uniref:Uncharacterized protein n=1 Tax=Cucumis melo TaxID=3656 RepID=A0A9I9CH35_CUCME
MDAMELAAGGCDRSIGRILNHWSRRCEPIALTKLALMYHFLSSSATSGFVCEYSKMRVKDYEPLLS